MSIIGTLPSEKLSYRKKTKEWRQRHIDWAESYIWNYDSRLRKNIRNKMINFNLMSGILNIEDLATILNPNNVKGSFIPDKIQHYPIINSKLHVLLGEESKRRFDYKLVVTNPEEVNEVEMNKLTQWAESLQEWATSNSQNQEEAERDLQKIVQYNKYQWQDVREIRGNCVLNHYIKELDVQKKFNDGFNHAMYVGEEAYLCDIVSGEPTFELINPNKMVVIRSGLSNRFEDADMIVLWDYWSPGRIIDTFYDSLTDKDMEYINNIPFSSGADDQENIDPRREFIFVDAPDADGVMVEGLLAENNIAFDSNYTDDFGNIRVVRVYWKSYRKILKIKSYDPETGEEVMTLMPETYKPNEALGEESEVLWINEAWEATKVGPNIYLNMRPKECQYNRMSNPSRCHFGIIGSVFNTNDNKPYSLVDMAKPYNYLYDVVHDRLNKNLAASWGKIMKMDLALVPKGWEIDKWMYYAKAQHLAVVDSFKEGNKGIATGKLAGMLNNQSSGVIDASLGDIIQQDIQLLAFIKQEMSEVMGISPQREGQITNRETVGGVERSVLQSNHITEWLFMLHEDIKKRALECLLETSKAALRGKTEKFQYLLSDGSVRIMDIDGDQFAECDYGILLENSEGSQSFIQKLEGYAQALIQNQMINTSTLLKLWKGTSIADITRSIEADEMQKQEEMAKQNEMQQQQFQANLEMQKEIEAEKLRLEEERNIRDNETKLLIAEMQLEGVQDTNNANAKNAENSSPDQSIDWASLDEKKREFNEKLSFERDKLRKTTETQKEIAKQRKVSTTTSKK